MFHLRENGKETIIALRVINLQLPASDKAEEIHKNGSDKSKDSRLEQQFKTFFFSIPQEWKNKTIALNAW